MDEIIKLDEVKTSIRDRCPSVQPRPGFANLRDLGRHLVKKLKTFPCPQSAVLGWAGIIMARVMYALVEPTAFQIPADPGPTAAYPHHRTLSRAEQTQIDRTFQRQKNYYLSYSNVYRAVFDLLDDVIDDSFKVSNNANHTGWNSTMSIESIWDQLTRTYGRPSPATLFENDKTFRTLYNPNDPPETLFKRLEDCQEVAILGDTPYTTEQILRTATHLLKTCGHYALEFRDWDRKPIIEKTYFNLKQFLQEAYTTRLENEGTTAAGAGFGPIVALDDDTDIDDDTVITLTNNVSALAMQGQQAAETTNRNTASINAAIQQLAQGQQALSNQMALMTVDSGATRSFASVTPSTTSSIPSMIPIPGYQPFQYQMPHMAAPAMGNSFPPNLNAPRQVAGGNFNQYIRPSGRGRGGGRGRGRGQGRGGRGRQGQGQGRGMGRGAQGGYAYNGGRGQQTFQAQQQRQPFSNTTKRHNNWNVCHSCGFDVEDWHTSATCPYANRREDHQEDVHRGNWEQKWAEGYNLSRRGIHKTQLPQM